MMKYKLLTDGSHQIELDIGGIGGLLLDENGQEVWTFSEEITNNKAQHELHALQYGLEKCIAGGIRDVVCFSDQKHLIESFTTEKQKESKISVADIKSRINLLKDSFDSIEFIYLPREQNKKADKLARIPLENALKEASPVDIFKRKNPDKKIFSHPKMLSPEQFISKEKYAKGRDKVTQYYVFDVKDTTQGAVLDIYSAEKKEKISSAHIKRLSLPKKWEDYIEAIATTISQSPKRNMVLIVPKGDIVGVTIRGLMPVSQKLSRSFERLEAALSSVGSVYIECRGKVYSHIFPVVEKPAFQSSKEKIDFMIASMKQMGDDYVLGSSPEMEKYFQLPEAKKEKIDEIQKKYFGEFMKMMNQVEKVPYQDAKKDLERQGIKFRF